jgi:hypothetical protein
LVFTCPWGRQSAKKTNDILGLVNCCHLKTVKKPPVIPDIPEQDQTSTVKALLALAEQFAQQIQLQTEEIARLKDEINILKGEKKRPVFKPSKLDKQTDKQKNSDQDNSKPSKKKRAKKSKTAQLKIHEEKVIKPDTPIPEGSRFKGYRDFVVQDLHINVHNIRYRLERWDTPDKKTLTAMLPSSLNQQHFGPHLISYILYQYHHCQTTQPLLLEQLREWGIEISAGQINQLLIVNKTGFHNEKDAILTSGLSVSTYITVDDSGARHQGKNGYVTQIGNDFFTWFKSTPTKSRVNFLELLRAGEQDYCLTESALSYMEDKKLPLDSLLKIQQHKDQTFSCQEKWLAWLEEHAITNIRHQRIATEGALLGSIFQHGLYHDLAIVSDGAGQFNVLIHGLCWVHTERLIHKLLPFNDAHRQDIAQVRDQIWTFYADLKDYKEQPTEEKKVALISRFDTLFTQKTRYQTLNQLLRRIHQNKTELLLVLNRPNIPLHTNGSETDIRDFVKKRKVSGGTRSDEGRKCRDTFISLKKTCRKLGVSFWQYLTDRHGIGEQTIPPLQDMVAECAFLAPGY